MPVQVEVRLVRLALGFEQRGRVLQERHAELVRAGRHRDAGASAARPRCRGRLIVLRIPFAHRRLDGEQRTRSRSRSTSRFVRLAQPLDVLVAVAREPDLDVVLAVLREGVRHQHAAARPEGQPLDVPFLRQVRRDPEGVAVRESLGRPTATRLIFCAAVM